MIIKYEDSPISKYIDENFGETIMDDDVSSLFNRITDYYHDGEI